MEKKKNKLQISVNIDDLKRGFEARGITFADGVFEESLKKYLNSGINKLGELVHPDKTPEIDLKKGVPCKLAELDFDANRAVLEPLDDKKVETIRKMLENGTAALVDSKLGSRDICLTEKVTIDPIEDFSIKTNNNRMKTIKEELLFIKNRFIELLEWMKDKDVITDFEVINIAEKHKGTEHLKNLEEKYGDREDLLDIKDWAHVRVKGIKEFSIFSLICSGMRHNYEVGYDTGCGFGGYDMEFDWSFHFWPEDENEAKTEPTEIDTSKCVEESK